jgi:hypothetical protein
LQRNGLAVVAGARAAHGDGNASARSNSAGLPNLGPRPAAARHVGDFAIELFAQHGRVPVEIARELLDDLRLREHAGLVAENFNDCANPIRIHM